MVDGHSKELPLPIEAVRSEVPTRSKAGRDRVAAEGRFTLADRTELHVAERPTLRVAPPRQVERAQLAPLPYREVERHRMSLQGERGLDPGRMKAAPEYPRREEHRGKPDELRGETARAGARDVRPRAPDDGKDAEDAPAHGAVAVHHAIRSPELSEPGADGGLPDHAALGVDHFLGLERQPLPQLDLTVHAEPHRRGERGSGCDGVSEIALRRLRKMR